MSAAPNQPPRTNPTKRKPGDVFKDTRLFARAFLKILDKQDVLRPLDFKPIQRRFNAETADKIIVVKSRQVGITTAKQADLFRKEVTRTTRTLTLAHEQDTTDLIRLMVDRFWLNMPEGMRPSRNFANSYMTTYPDFDSSAVIATAGNRKKGRGGSSTEIHGTEVAFWKDAATIIAGAGQGGSPRITLESSPNGAQGWFYETTLQALDGNNDWTVLFYPWWVDPEYRIALAPDEDIVYTESETNLAVKHGLSREQIKWRRAKQRELKHLFPQEYPEDIFECFLLSGNGYFGVLKDVFVVEFGLSPDPAHRYVAGLDFGQMDDFTVLSIFDTLLNCQVALHRVNHKPWETMRGEVAALCKFWGVSMVLGEANAMGTTNIEALAALGLPLIPWWTSNDSKASLMGDLHEGLHHSGVKLLPVPEQQHEFAAFTATQTPQGAWRLAAPERDGEHDDTVIATALSYRARLGGGSTSSAW